MTISGAILLAVAAQGAVAPLSPTGKWQVDQGASRCSLVRDYGADGQAVTLAFERGLSGKSVAVALRHPTAEVGRSRDGKAKVSFGGDAAIDVDWYAAPASAGFETIKFRLASDVVARAPVPPVFTLSRAGRAPVALALPGLTNGWSALEACRTDMLSQWKVDRDEEEKVAREPKAIGDEGMFISMRDYPPSAMRAGAEGTTNLLFTIGASGRVTECRVIESSGNADLDGAGCAALYGRARYEPAVGRDGVAMDRHIMRRMIWRLPR